MVAEAQHEGAVFGSEDVLQENFEIVLVLPGVMLLAAAGINNDSESERNIGTPGKECNLLRNRVLKKLEVVLRQIVDRCPAGIPHRERHIHQVDLDANGLLRKTADSGQ